jgi:hypothetical protein
MPNIIILCEKCVFEHDFGECMKALDRATWQFGPKEGYAIEGCDAGKRVKP